jgi:hypothetical protein
MLEYFAVLIITAINFIIYAEMLLKDRHMDMLIFPVILSSWLYVFSGSLVLFLFALIMPAGLICCLYVIGLGIRLKNYWVNKIITARENQCKYTK